MSIIRSGYDRHVELDDIISTSETDTTRDWITPAEVDARLELRDGRDNHLRLCSGTQPTAARIQPDSAAEPPPFSPVPIVPVPTHTTPNDLSPL
jgi:hypothetical protein